jgi:uncharacterized membrane protein
MPIDMRRPLIAAIQAALDEVQAEPAKKHRGVGAGKALLIGAGLYTAGRVVVGGRGRDLMDSLQQRLPDLSGSDDGQDDAEDDVDEEVDDEEVDDEEVDDEEPEAEADDEPEAEGDEEPEAEDEAPEAEAEDEPDAEADEDAEEEAPPEDADESDTPARTGSRGRSRARSRK